MAYASAGQRDLRVTIEQGTPGKAASGQPITTWATLGDVYMHRAEVSGAERLAAAQIQASVGHEWELPYWASMDPDLVDVPKLRRLVYRGRPHNITRAALRQRPEGRAIRIWTAALSGDTA